MNTLLLVVEQPLLPQITSSLDTYSKERMEAGYTVRVIAAPTFPDSIQSANWIRSNIWPILDTNTSVFLIGNVPMPRSGMLLNPDGHVTWGAYSAPAYYVTPSDKWADQWSNGVKGSFGNLPNDGKFDNDTLPAKPICGLGMLTFGKIANESVVADAYFKRLSDYRAGKWNVLPVATYAYAANATQWAQAPATIPKMQSVFASGVKYKAEGALLKATTKGQPSVQVILLKTANYASVLWKCQEPPSVAWEAYNSGQFELRVSPHCADVFASIRAAKGPLVIALNHPDWTLDLKAGETWGNIWKNTFSKPNAPTWSWVMGDPTIVLAGAKPFIISDK